MERAASVHSSQEESQFRKSMLLCKWDCFRSTSLISYRHGLDAFHD